MGTPVLRILAVCTANQCRSPLVEFALQRRIDALELPWSVGSAGTQARPGLLPHPSTRRLLSRHGSQWSGWTSSRLDAELVDSADLILTASLDNRNQLIRAWPEAAAKSFTLIPFALHCSEHPAGLAGAGSDHRTLTSWLREARERLPATQVDKDLPDPMGRSSRTFRQVDVMVEMAVSQILPVPWGWW